MKRGGALGGVLSAMLVALYAVAAFYTATRAQHSPWAVLIAIGPLSVAALLFLRNVIGRDHPGRYMPVLLAALAALAWAWPQLQQHLGWTYYLQHLGMMLAGALAFGLSLRGGRTPLCTLFAGFVHATLSPALQRYTRQVTVAWTLFFVLMAIASTLLFFSSLPWAVWSAFDTLLTLPLVGLMFVVEYAVRCRVLPQEPGLGVSSAFRAYQAYQAQRALQKKS